MGQCRFHRFVMENFSNGGLPKPTQEAIRRIQVDPGEDCDPAWIGDGVCDSDDAESFDEEKCVRLRLRTPMEITNLSLQPVRCLP